MKRIAFTLLTLVLGVTATLIGTAGSASTIVPLSKCSSHPTFAGNSGVINLGTGSGGSFVWGGRMIPTTREPGVYRISVYAGSKVKDEKNGHYPYFPHGSLPASIARPGYRMSISVTLVSDTGNVYTSVQNRCIM